MYRALADFEHDWREESDGTLRLLRALTDVSLAQAVAPGGRTLGRLAWHTVTSLYEMLEHAGLPVAGAPGDDAVPPAAEMVRLYEAGSRAVLDAVLRSWTDASLTDTIAMYGESWPRGRVLSGLILHQAHHRAQMTVLMRQAGLPVAGVYGPSKEEWGAMGMAPQE